MQHREPLRQDNPALEDQPDKGYYVLELTGKDRTCGSAGVAVLWPRLKNKMRGFFGRHSPRGKTVKPGQIFGGLVNDYYGKLGVSLYLISMK